MHTHSLATLFIKGGYVGNNPCVHLFVFFLIFPRKFICLLKEIQYVFRKYKKDKWRPSWKMKFQGMIVMNAHSMNPWNFVRTKLGLF